MDNNELTKDHERYIGTGTSLMSTSAKVLMSQYKQAARYIGDFPVEDQNDYGDGLRICVFVQKHLNPLITREDYARLHLQLDVSADKLNRVLGDYSRRLEEEDTETDKPDLYETAGLQLEKMKAFIPDQGIPAFTLSNWTTLRDELDIAIHGMLFDSPMFRESLAQVLEKAVDYHDYMVQLSLYLEEERK